MYSVWLDYVMPCVPVFSVVVLAGAVVGLIGLYFSAENEDF